MARHLYRRRNPDLFGEDVMDLAWEALGIGVSAVGNDKIVAPVIGKVVPGSFSGGTFGKLIDAGTTALTGWGVGEVVGFVNKPIGRKMKKGGVLLGVAKVLSAFIPGFALSANFPSIPLPSFGAPKAIAPAPTAPVNGNGTATLTRLGVGKMGL